MLVGSSDNHVTITIVTRLLVLGRRRRRWALILIAAGENLQLYDDNDHRTMTTTVILTGRPVSAGFSDKHVAITISTMLLVLRRTRRQWALILLSAGENL